MSTQVDAKKSKPFFLTPGGTRGSVRRRNPVCSEMPVEAKIREVAPEVYQIYLPLPMRPNIVNVYLIRSGWEWALVDTGMQSAESMAALTETLVTVGCPPVAIRQLLATHHHPDHFGASGAYKEFIGGEVYLNALEVEQLKRIQAGSSPASLAFLRRHGVSVPDWPWGVPSQGQMWGSLYTPVFPDRLINDGDIIRIGAKEIRVVWTPGHTPGHCCFYLPQEKVLIVGDHLLPKITPHIGVYAGGPENPLGDFIDSLRKVQNLDVALVLPAHGAVYKDHRYRTHQLVQHHEYRKQEMYDTIRRRAKTAYEIALEVFGPGDHRPFFHTIAATSETLAHLHLLLYQGKVRRLEEEDRVRFLAQ
jgi:glyoxylase-like metal-dependent hydrolase (beta-lactamase superfamily II)